MIVTIFRSRHNPGVHDEYGPMAQRMSELAKKVPGYISHKGFVADDGERVTIVEFESEAALRAWQVDREHGKAKRQRSDDAGIERLEQLHHSGAGDGGCIVPDSHRVACPQWSQ